MGIRPDIRRRHQRADGISHAKAELRHAAIIASKVIPDDQIADRRPAKDFQPDVSVVDQFVVLDPIVRSVDTHAGLKATGAAVALAAAVQNAGPLVDQYAGAVGRADDIAIRDRPAEKRDARACRGAFHRAVGDFHVFCG